MTDNYYEINQEYIELNSKLKNIQLDEIKYSRRYEIIDKSKDWVRIKYKSNIYLIYEKDGQSVPLKIVEIHNKNGECVSAGHLVME